MLQQHLVCECHVRFERVAAHHPRNAQPRRQVAHQCSFRPRYSAGHSVPADIGSFVRSGVVAQSSERPPCSRARCC